MRAVALTVVTTALVALVACQPVEGPGDFAAVLPDERVQINLPVEEARRTTEWSPFYAVTANVTEDVNGLIGHVLGMVGAVTDLPATWSDTEEHTAVWGPYGSGLDAAETILWVRHLVETDEYEWVVGQRPRNAGEEVEWTPVIVGHVEPGASDVASAGWFAIDFDAAAELDPTTDLRGRFLTEYALDADGVTATAGFEAFGEAAGGRTDAYYHFDQAHSGGGMMDLVFQGDVGEDGSALETNVIRSRWLPTGAGRADVYVTGGDLGEAVATATDCWGEAFTTVYWEDSFSGNPPAGEAAACAFGEPSFNEEEVVSR